MLALASTRLALNHNSFYSNQGNRLVLGLLSEQDKTILDVGCGAGDTAHLLSRYHPSIVIDGITVSEAEHVAASRCCNKVFRLDIESDPLPEFALAPYDALLFLHVLEHLVNPVEALRRFLPHLRAGGKVLIAVPNIVFWKNRWQLMLGRFNYSNAGTMDHTHLRFYTFQSARQYLIDPIRELELQWHFASGNIPLGPLRHHLLSRNTFRRLDEKGAALFPNLFGYEIVMTAVKKT